MSGLNENRKEALKKIIKQLHAGEAPENVKEKFKQVLDGLTPLEISKIEQELINEGISREEIQKLCEIHLAVFKEQLEKQRIQQPQGHPINILMEEHKAMLKLSEKLNEIANKIQAEINLENLKAEKEELKHIIGDLIDSEKHYLREENVLFPFLEKHGITEPPAIMWMEHDKIREKKNKLRELTDKIGLLNTETFKIQLKETAFALQNLLSSHFYKENNILFPTALRVINDVEWSEIREEFDEIGYCCFTPPKATVKTSIEASTKTEAYAKSLESNIIEFETGSFNKEELEAILNTLPIDITFVDEDDKVRYFNKGEERIFIRTKAAIGRKVQQCHPQKSVNIVNRILDAFKKGEKNVAEFWIQKGDRLIHIRYFAVRDKNGKYLGTMEVTQDITDIKRIEGEKRLLDWAAESKELKNPKILVFYYSKTDSTRRLAEAIAKGARTVPGVEVTVADDLKPEALVEFDAILIGSPTYYHDIPLQLKKFLENVAMVGINLQGKIGAVFGSYGWSKEGPERVIEIMRNRFQMKILAEPLLVKYSPREEDIQRCIEFGRKIAEKLVTG